MISTEQHSMSANLQDYFQTAQALVQDGLHTALQELATESLPDLMEAMRYSLLGPGKRLRPILTCMAADASGGSPEQALPAACAVEMIHCYSLVHDDLPAMDDDDLRRGLPTCHRKFGEAMAILVGDALQSLAFEILATGYPAATAAACCRELARAAGAAGMVGGQAEDLDGEKRGGSLNTLMQLHGRKTGALFRACLKLGVLAVQGERPGGPDPALVAALDEYGRCFGLAFQITDDLLDVEGDVQQTGKRVQKDAGRGKLTYPGILGVQESRRRAHQLEEQAALRLQLLGEAGTRLLALFRFVLERDR
jgi:geranylgeranyl diphosphate synthase type II